MRGKFIFIVLMWTTFSQSQPNPFITYTPRDGLVSARVRNAYQDSKGRIYFMTYAGLSVFDGVRFKNYTMRDGLWADMVNDILEIGNDSLLIATNSSQSFNLLTRNGMENFPLAVESTPIVNQFIMDADGVVYMTADYGLFRLDGNELYKFDLPQLPPGLPPYLGNICDAGRYLIFTTNDLKNYTGLYLFDKSSETILDYDPKVVAHNIIKDFDGRIWILGMNHLSLIDATALRQGKLLQTDSVKSIYSVAEITIQNVAFGEEQSWFFYPENRVEIMSRNGEPIIMHIPSLENMGGISSMTIDKEQILWIGTNGGGVMKITKPQYSVLQPLNEFDADIRITKVTATSRETWHHSYLGIIYHRKKDQFLNISENLPPTAQILGVIADTLYARDENKLYSAPKSAAHSLHFTPVLHLRDTSFFSGAFMVDPYDGILTGSNMGLMYVHNGRSTLAYPMEDVDMIEALWIDRENFLWLVSRHLSIVKFEFAADLARPLTVSKVYPIKHLHISPRTAMMDNEGHIWIGSRSHGIYVFKPQNDSLKILSHFDTESGLTDNFITCLLKCPDGSILAGTQSGLDRIRHMGDYQYRIENLTKRSNFFAFIQSLWIEEDSITFALTLTGQEIEVYPVDKDPSLKSPQLFVDEVKVNGMIVRLDKGSFYYNENNFVFSICAPSFIDEKQVQYSYKLEGGTQSAWSEASPANANINLLNLRPGKYTLYLRAEFPSTFYHAVESLYRFTIRPAWWQTSLAKIALFLLLFCITGMVMYFFNRRKLERQRASLEKRHAIQEERTRISGDLHDDLGAGLSTIRFLAEKIKLTKEAVSTSTLDRIQDTSDELTDKMNEIIWAMSEKHDTLDDLLSYTRSYIATYCDDHGLVCHLRFPDEIPYTFVSGQVRRNVFLSIKESLHNILKHAQAHNVYIEIRLDHNLHICIRDDGKGIAKEALDQKSGHGLKNMQKRIGSLGGNLSITNNPGVVVEFSIPLKQNSL